MSATRAPIRLGRNLLPALQTVLVTTAILLGAVLTTNFAIGKYQDKQVQARAARTAALQHMALNALRGDVQSVTDLGDGVRGRTVAITGAGLIGLLVGLLARLHGAREVAVIDADPRRRAVAERLGMLALNADDDVDGDPVYLASSAFMMRRTAEMNPGLTFRDIKDVRAEKAAA